MSIFRELDCTLNSGFRGNWFLGRKIWLKHFPQGKYSTKNWSTINFWTLEIHQKAISLLFASLSIMVVWSECTFWVRSRTLSLFALIVKNASNKHNYFNLEIFCIFIIGYLCFCAYSTLFQIKVDFFFLITSLEFRIFW